MSFDANGIVCTDIHKASFELMDDEEIKKMAVCRIYSTVVYDGTKPKLGGVHDPRMGPMDSEPRRGDPSCVTCGGKDDCPGHLGYIDLHLPAFHPLFINKLVKLLKCTCLVCKRLKISASVVVDYLRLFKELANGGSMQDAIGATATSIENWRKLVDEVFNLCAQSHCSHCGRKFSTQVRKKDLDSCIELLWSYDSDCPVDRAVLLKLLDYKEEEIVAGSQGDQLGTIRDIRQLAVVDDEVIAKDHKVLGRRGRAMGSCQLEAYQVYPLIRDLYNSSDRELLNCLIPATARHGAKFFFMMLVPVSSNKFRPKASSLGFGTSADDKKDESGGILHPRSAALLEIIAENNKVGFALASLRYQEESALAIVTEEAKGAFLPNLNTKDKASVEKAIVDHKGNYSLLHQYSKNTQEKVNAYVDSTKTRTRNPPPAIRQWMEKKSGAIRQKMMGKRVNFAARTTIAPDALINTNEIGIPLPFAMKLSIQEHANPHNVDLLCKLVMNGSKVYPGCNMIIEPNGRKLDLTRRELTDSQKKMQCKLIRNYVEQQHSPVVNGKIMRPYTVLRHLRDGDVVIMNRQPSLHRASMMAHFVRVLTGQKTFRLHYANCNSYNADFDGDEMNLHCAQDYHARAEASIFCNADCNYNVAKSGEPLRGLIQDHVLGGNFLTVRGTFLTRSEYFALIYIGVGPFVDKGEKIDLTDEARLRVVYPEFSSGDPYARMLGGGKNLRVVTEEPTILKPEPLWTGKQVINSILKTLIDSTALIQYGVMPDGKPNLDFLEKYRGINLENKAKTPGDAWMGKLGSDKEEQTVIIRNSELLQGVFDKSQIGASTYGLVHLCYELFGPRVAGMLLSVFGRVFSCYLQIRGFSCSSGDFQMTNEGEHARNQMILRCTAAGTLIQEQFIDSIYKHMHWKENVEASFDKRVNDTAVNRLRKVETLMQETCLPKPGHTGSVRESYVKMKQEHYMQGEASKLTIDGVWRDPATIKFQGASPFWPETQSKPSGIQNNSWALSRAAHDVSGQPDWRLGDLTEMTKWLQAQVNRMKTMAGGSNQHMKQMLCELFTTTPELALYFPKLASKVQTARVWNGSLPERIETVKSAPIFRAPKCLLPPPANYKVTLPSGTVIEGDGALRAPKMYHPSWVWHDTAAPDLSFESPMRYIVRALDIERSKVMAISDAKNQQSEKPIVLTPSEVTRQRMERLVRDYFSGREDVFLTMFDKFFQANMSKLSSRNNDLVTGDVSLYPFPQNGFSSMITTGAKGSKVNFAMICGMLSQQSLEGKRVPVMISGKTHPSFAPWDLGARAGGLITDRYLSGLRPPDYFFHCMAGREGLVDTAVKTARSGYLQRCVIKSLEGMVVSYDGSVREGDGSVVQFLYGEDGADVAKMVYLHNLSDLLANPAVLEAKCASRAKLNNPVLKEKLKVLDEALVQRRQLEETWSKKSEVYPGEKDVVLAPLTARYPPFTYPGSISEWYEQTASEQLDKALKNKAISFALVSQGLIRNKDLKKDSSNIMYKSDGRMSTLGRILRLKYRNSLAEPGDAVGCLAAQSMGEPATQMTLNTFHLAGHGAANVTLGIPRLREILQTAGNASTPVLYIPVKGTQPAEYKQNCQKLIRGFRRINLTDIINAVGIEANIHGRKTGACGLLDKRWVYECTIQFENLDHFCKVIPKYTPQKLVNFTINRVVRELMKTVNKYMAVYATKASEEMWDTDDDELNIAAEKFVFERHIRTIQDKKKLTKEALKAAGIGFGAHGGGRGNEDDMDVDLLAAADDFGAIYKKSSKKKGDEEVDDEQGDAEFDTDVSNDDSEGDLTDPNGSDGEIIPDDEEEEEEEPVTPAVATPEDTAEDTDMEEVEEQIAKTKRQKKENKRIARLEEMEPDVIEDEALWEDGTGAGFRSKQLPSEAYRYMDSFKVCRKTWRIIVKWSWPVERCPRKIEFMPALVRIIRKQVLQNTPGVANPHVVSKQDAHTKKNKKENVDCEIQCEGSNLEWVAQLSDECVDHNKVGTNDIRSIFKFYGVEAGRASIIKELSSVFGVYGITVDYRHLSLIADSMTRSGEFRAFSRLGMSYHSSPLLQMSFETSIKFLTEGVERGAVDNLKCPAGAIVVGRNTTVGTGISRPLIRLPIH